MTYTVCEVIASKGSVVYMVRRPELAPIESQVGVIPAAVKVLDPQKLNPSWLPRLELTVSVTET